MKKDILSELDGKEYTEGLYRDYEIRFCHEDEYKDIRVFIRDYWSENHIFVISKEVFDFQHLDKEKHRYNFVIAKERKSGDIHAILGFIPTSHFDSKIKRTMIWPCIWKVRKDVNRKGLGVTMYYHLKTNIKIETISILGVSEIALSIYKHWNFRTGKINQYVMPNFTAKQHLAKGLIENYNKFEVDSLDEYILHELDEDEYLNISEDDPIFSVNIYKTHDYYENRFFKHPIYKYYFLAIKVNEEVRGIIIARSCGNGINNCLRIVDYIGELKYLAGVKNQVQNYLQRKKYEYVDFVEVGLDETILKRAGFVNRKEYSNMIVPNYFEPFLQGNIDLDYAYKSVIDDSKGVFFKADADQDRPSVLS